MNKYSDKFVVANNITHHYLEWGTSSAKPILMLHGIGLSAHLWNWTAQKLADQYHILSFDMRGHGDSQKPETGYTFRELAIDLNSIVTELNLYKPYVVGHSAGGSAAIIGSFLISLSARPTYQSHQAWLSLSQGLLISVISELLELNLFRNIFIKKLYCFFCN